MWETPHGVGFVSIKKRGKKENCMLSRIDKMNDGVKWCQIIVANDRLGSPSGSKLTVSQIYAHSF